MTRDHKLHCARHVALGIGFAVVVGGVFGWVVMTAWNAAIPALFNLPAIGFWQAVAVLVLARLLVGRFSHGALHGRLRHRWGHHHDSAALYTAWWDAEGESAFKDFVARQSAAPGADGR
jgi:hypothetical protein